MALDYVPEVTASMGVADLNRAIAWYQDVLDFSLLYADESIGWAELSTAVPGVNVGLSQVESVGQGGGATNVWTVSNIENAKAHLDAKGVRQDGPIQTIPNLVKLLTFFDPDGNAMMFAQSLQSESR